MKDTDIIQRAIPYMKNNNQVIANFRSDFDIPKEERTGKHYVMWSGGCDSTLLLYEVLEAYGPENVVIVSYNYPWLTESKRGSEAAHRTAFRAKLMTRNKEYIDHPITHIEFNIDVKVISGQYQNVNGGGLPQAVAWLLSTPIYAKSDSYIYTGAIKSDDLTLYMEQYHELFSGVSRTLDRKIHLREPYLFLTKANVIEKLIRYGIYDVTWFCEMPTGVDEPCYECTPCKTHIAALTELSLGPNDDIVTVQAKLELEKIKKAIDHNRTTAKEKKFPDKDVSDSSLTSL